MVLRSTVRLLAALLALSVLSPCPTQAQDTSPFSKLAGRWLGEGRLGARNGTTENVKCRVTYVVSDDADQVRQTIRCASPSGSVEVQSIVTHDAGKLSGTWKELSRDWSGELAGNVTPHGFRVSIRGPELNANMDIIVKGNRQIIETHFIEGALIGLTLLLKKG